MRGHYLLGVLAAALAMGACNRTPVAPSENTLSGTMTDAAAVSAVAGTVSLAVSQSALGQSGFMSSPTPTFSYPCRSGGSITSIFLPSVPTTEGFTASYRMEFNDCASQGVVMRGDPYLTTTMEFKGTPWLASSTVTMTMHTTGGMRMVSNGVEGRIQYDCTTSFSGVAPGAQTIPPLTSSGTITLEKPTGSTPRVMSCGPSGP